MRQITTAALAIAFRSSAGIAVAADPDIRSILAPSGTLRVALYR
jgi:hypothetical protein